MNAKEILYNCEPVMTKLMHEDGACGGEIEFTGNVIPPTDKRDHPLYTHKCMACGELSNTPAVYPKITFESTTIRLEMPPKPRIVRPN